MSRSFDFVVVGTGVTGASTAYHLARRGAGRILLLDRIGPAAGGTGKSSAIIRQHYSTRIATRLAQQSIGQFTAMQDELGASGGYEKVGWTMLVPDRLLAGARENVAMHQSLGVRTAFMTESEIAALEWLNPEGVAAAIYEPDGGYADPIRTTEAYLAAFRRLGGIFMDKTTAQKLLGSSARVDGIATAEGPIAAGCVINAAGPWSKALAATVGLDLPMKSIRIQESFWRARPNRPIPHGSVSNAVDAIYLRPHGDGLFAVGRGDPFPIEEADHDSYDQNADEDALFTILERMEKRFPPMTGCARVDAFAAIYDVTPDWYPVVGPRGGTAGYADASGGSGHGFKIAPAVGRNLADWLLDGRTDPEMQQLSHDRFAQRRLFVQAYGGNRG